MDSNNTIDTDRDNSVLSTVSRKREIDILKGIGILAVFIGHMGSPYAGDTILGYVYSFHMPLFFLVSGYLSVNIGKYKFAEYTKKKAKDLLVPYTVFFIFSFIWTNTVYALTQGQPIFSFPFTKGGLVRAFFLSGGYLEKIPLNNFPLWFLPLLFIASVAFYGFSKVKSTAVLLALALAISFATIPFQNIITGRPAWHINVLPAALVYMLVGYLFHKYEGKIRYGDLRGFLMFSSLIAGYLVFSIIGSQGGIAQLSSYWYFAASILTVYGLYLFSITHKSNLLEYLGKNSLYYFSLQVLVLLELPVFQIDRLFIGIGQSGLVIYFIQLASGVFLTSLLVIAVKYLGSLATRLAGNVALQLSRHRSAAYEPSSSE